jgi:hypothetical protein
LQGEDVKALVAYYSMTGSSEKAAKALAEHLESKGHKATIEQIIPKSGYSKIKAYTVGCVQALRKSTIELVPPKNNPSEFGIIAIITPTWAAACSPPAYSFAMSLLEAKKGQKAIAISINAGTPGTSASALADVFGKKGYSVLATITVPNVESLRSELEAKLKL